MSWEIIVTYTNPDTGGATSTVVAQVEDYIYAQFISSALNAEEEEPNREYTFREAHHGK